MVRRKLKESLPLSVRDLGDGDGSVSYAEFADFVEETVGKRSSTSETRVWLKLRGQLRKQLLARRKVKSRSFAMRSVVRASALDVAAALTLEEADTGLLRASDFKFKLRKAPLNLHLETGEASEIAKRFRVGAGFDKRERTTVQAAICESRDSLRVVETAQG